MSPVVSWNVTVDCVEKKISKMIDLRTIGKEHHMKSYGCVYFKLGSVDFHSSLFFDLVV